MLLTKLSLSPRKVAVLAAAVSALGFTHAKATEGYADWVTINHLATSYVKGQIKAMDIPVQGFLRGGQHWPKGWWTPDKYGFAGPTIPPFTRVRALYSHEFTPDKSCPQGYMAVSIVDSEGKFKDVSPDQTPVAVVCASNLGRIPHLEHIARKVGHACYNQIPSYTQLGFKYSRTSQSKSKVNRKMLVAPVPASPVYTVTPEGTPLMVTAPGVQYWNAWAGLKQLSPTSVVAKFADYTVQYPCPVALVMGIPQGQFNTGAYSYQIMEANERLPLDFKERFQVSTVDVRPLVHGLWGQGYWNWAWNQKGLWPHAKFQVPFNSVDVSKFPPFVPMEKMLTRNFANWPGMYGRPFGGAFVVSATRGLKLQSSPSPRSRVVGSLTYREPVVASAAMAGPGCSAGWVAVSSTVRPGRSGYVCAKHLAPSWGAGLWGARGGWQNSGFMNLGPDEMNILMGGPDALYVRPDFYGSPKAVVPEVPKPAEAVPAPPSNP